MFVCMQKSVTDALLIWRLAAQICVPGDRATMRGPCNVWRLAARCVPSGDIA